MFLWHNSYVMNFGILAEFLIDREYFYEADLDNIEVLLALIHLSEYINDKNYEKSFLILPSEYKNPEISFAVLKVGDTISVSRLENLLRDLNYQKSNILENYKNYVLLGNIFAIYEPTINCEIKMILDFDSIEKIVVSSKAESIEDVCVNNILLSNVNPISTTGYLSSIEKFLKNGIYEKPIILSNTSNRYTKLPIFQSNQVLLKKYFENKKFFRLFYSGEQIELLKLKYSDILDQLGIKIEKLKNINLSFGFEIQIEYQNYIFLTDYELFGRLNLAKSRPSSKFSNFFDTLVNIGDYVVHESHGVGIYQGIEEREVLNQKHQYVVIQYANDDVLLVPLTQLSKITKYVTTDGYLPQLTRLGTAEWEVVKRKLKKNLEFVAKELLEIYAKRNFSKGISFNPDDELMREFEKSVPYELTVDQIKAISEVKSNMESEKPMDRLLIGDVGFGKTEVALHASVKAVISSKQVIVIAPTTLLVTQLYNVFFERLNKFGIRVARVSRFDGNKNNKENIKLFNEGKIDVLIGTHKVLSSNIESKDVGLLIIDEEQRFGVRQKEKIRKIRANIDVLSMTATPIPRTLHMALTGIKDISILATPPKNRLPVKTSIIFLEEIFDKIRFELERNGQVIILHNEIETINAFASPIIQEFGIDNVCIAHSKIDSKKLEDIMLNFLNEKYKILISTTIIENGLDIPNANTIIINKAHEFGVGQLYQLRGRVGRRDKQGYCYLIVPKIKEFLELHPNLNEEDRNLLKILLRKPSNESHVTKEAIERIKVIIQNQELGAGFKIASRDLEIRGSGNLLGVEQSGFINSVGYEMYIRLIEQEIEKIKHLNFSPEQN